MQKLMLKVRNLSDAVEFVYTQQDRMINVKIIKILAHIGLHPQAI
ncbi:hypothetical protein TrispH2_006781 [Trichoplax sp. H2]|nr:hypothetical protein TrispH2_006781 [Trichoplax sp. H2]|eukprot:RDD40367.1 hypothetical protein TrispH2_006781 [Trichoplax sp. H2]